MLREQVTVTVLTLVMIEDCMLSFIVHEEMLE